MIAKLRDGRVMEVKALVETEAMVEDDNGRGDDNRKQLIQWQLRHDFVC